MDEGQAFMHALLRTCTALASCRHPRRKRARYRILLTQTAPENPHNSVLEVERCRACGALRLQGTARLVGVLRQEAAFPSNAGDDWERSELAEALAGELGPETLRISGELLEAAFASAEILRSLEAIAALWKDGSSFLDASALGHVIEAMHEWHSACEQIAASFVTAHVQSRGSA